MIELIERRQENSKTFRLGGGKNRLVVSIGAIHYKDDYALDEQWKDINLTWEGNRITKAPYELLREGNKLTIRNKKNGEVNTIELLEGATPDVDIEIVPEFSRVRFTRILKSNKAPLTAKFKVTGNFIVRASDEDGEIPVESTVKDGILTETLKPDRPVKYPVRIDPTWQVGISSDDCYRGLAEDVFTLVTSFQYAGASTTGYTQRGGGMHFTGIAIAQGTPILDGTHLTLRCKLSEDTTVCDTRISAEDVDDAPTFADDSGAFDTRWAARTTARVEWDAIPAWTADVDYNSPEIKTVIQEIVDRGGWNSGQDIVIFWDDFEDRSGLGALRFAYSWDGSNEFAPKLVITYTEVENKSANMAAKMMGGGMI